MGREDGFRKFERRGYAGMARPKGLLVWVHVASVGEMITVLPLIRKLLESHPAAQTLLTSGTVTSAKIANDNPHERIINILVNNSFMQIVICDFGRSNSPTCE